MRSRTSMRDEQGAAVVEFALVMPILALIVFGIIDHGRAFYTVNNIVSAVREGSRYGAIRSAPLSASGQSEIRDRVRNVSAPFGGDTVRDEHIEIEFDGELVTVRVDSFPFRPLTPIASALGVGTWPITRAASTTTLTAPTSTTTSRDEGAVMTPQEPNGHGPVPLADAVQSLSGAIVYYRDIEEDHRRGLVGCRVLGRAHSLVVRARMQVIPRAPCLAVPSTRRIRCVYRWSGPSTRTSRRCTGAQAASRDVRLTATHAVRSQRLSSRKVGRFPYISIPVR